MRYGENLVIYTHESGKQLLPQTVQAVSSNVITIVTYVCSLVYVASTEDLELLLYVTLVLEHVETFFFDETRWQMLGSYGDSSQWRDLSTSLEMGIDKLKLPQISSYDKPVVASTWI
jgi:hypothetical protein